MSGSHPLFNVDDVLDFPFLSTTIVGILFHEVLWLVISFEVRPEVLQKSHLFLQLFRVLSESVRRGNILPITAAPLHVIQVVPIRVKNDLG